MGPAVVDDGDATIDVAGLCALAADNAAISVVTDAASGFRVLGDQALVAFRRLVVQVARPSVTARTKRGYYGPVSH